MASLEVKCVKHHCVEVVHLKAELKAPFARMAWSDLRNTHLQPCGVLQTSDQQEKWQTAEIAKDSVTVQGNL